MGRWNWCFGPPPFGLHYARHLFRDGASAATSGWRLMQPEAAGAVWDHRQTWREPAAGGGPPHDVGRRPRVRVAATVDGPFFGWVSFTDPHHPMDAPAPWCDRYAPEDVLEVLPVVHPDELENKPPLHKVLAQGLRGRPLEWANPGGATLTREDLAVMTAGLLRDGRAARPRDRPRARRARRARARRRHARDRHDRSRRVPRRAPDDLQGAVRLRLVAARAAPRARSRAFRRAGWSTIRSARSTSRRRCSRQPAPSVPAWIEGRPLLDGPREWVLSENDFSIVTWLPDAHAHHHALQAAPLPRAPVR